jgi:hypothetical protein
MATYKTIEELEKAGDGAELRAALKAAQGKVVEVKRIRLLTGHVYVTGEIAKPLLKELTGAGKAAVIEFSLGVSGHDAYVSRIDEKDFMLACRNAGISIAAVRKVDNVAAALRTGSAG